MQTYSHGGAQYFVTFIDDFSHRTIVPFIAKKSDVFDKFVEYKNMAETQTGCKMNILRSDNGGEYISARFTKYCLDHRILRQFTAAYTPQ